jgi:peptidyl-prolyl cis-trans isomerase D
LESGNNSEPVEIGGNRIIVLRVQDRKLPAQRTLDEVRAEITDLLRTKQAQTMAAARGKALLERLRNGEDRESVAAAEGLQWSPEVSLVRRDAASSADPQVRDTLFGMPRPSEEGVPGYAAIVDSTANYVIIALHSVADGDPQKVDAQIRESLQNTLRRDYGQEIYNAYVQSIKNQADINIHKDRL